MKYFNNLFCKQTSFKMASKYVLRKNNYKVNLKTKIMKEINVCMDKIDEINKNNTTDIASKITNVRRIYLLFNKNIGAGCFPLISLILNPAFEISNDVKTGNTEGSIS